jgi:hypothetical protein
MIKASNIFWLFEKASKNIKPLKSSIRGYWKEIFWSQKAHLPLKNSQEKIGML